MSAQKLYTPELLGLAVSLADYPLDAGLPLSGEARSTACGSTLGMALALDDEGRIKRIGMRVRACAVGQAAAAIFARSSTGRDADAIDQAHQGMRGWLAGESGAPDWPGLALLEPARGYPGRHGAILLPWRAASAALSTVPAER